MVNPFKRSRRNQPTQPPTYEEGESSEGGVAGTTRWNYFRNQGAKNAYEERYANRQVLSGRPIDEECLSEFPVIEWLNRQGWTELLSKDFEVYPTIVSMFYANMKVKSEGNKNVLDCFVKGVQFKLTEKKIREIFNIQSTAARPRRSITPAMAKIELLGEHAGDEANHAARLDLPTRLLMLIVSWSVRPTSGNFTRLTEVTAKIMHDVKFGNYANLGEIMMTHMVNASYHATANLPYGMWLTPIMEHFGVDLSYEAKYKVPDSHKIGGRSLTSMGYERAYPRGPWRKRQERQDESEEEDEEEEGSEENQEEEPQEQDDEPVQDEAPVHPTREADSGYLPYMARIDMLQEEMRTTRDEVRATREELRGTREELRGTREEVRAVREAQGSFFTEMRESQHSYHASMHSQWSGMNDNLAGINRYIQEYMASRPADFPPPAPPADED